MIDKVFELLMVSPVLSIVLGFVLAVVVMILFKDVIKSYLKKKWNLYEEQEVKEAIHSSIIETSKDFTEGVSQSKLERTIMQTMRDSK